MAQEYPKYCLTSEVSRYVSWIGKKKAEELVRRRVIRGWRLPKDADGRQPVTVDLDSVFAYVESTGPEANEAADREAIRDFLAGKLTEKN
jgi:hypothetical protein